MCGFTGVLKLDGSLLSVEFEEVIASMAGEIAHRGPDDEQIWRDGPLALAFRRLSIVDLAGGRQPLYNEDGSLVLVANGEIYNYKQLAGSLSARHEFRTGSDCEILLHLYEEQGQEFLKQLVGMYAFALWDRRQRKLLLACDRFGIKPLFYTLNRERLVFASEIKALLRYPDCPRAFDWDAALTDPFITSAVAMNWAPPASFFSEIIQLPAGTFLEVDLINDRVGARTYWRLPILEKSAPLADGQRTEAVVEHYADLLRESVENCLMSDVEIGSFLSGGIDSALVTTFAARSDPLHTFTVLSQSTFTNQDAYYAHLTAKWCGVPNHQVLFRWQESRWGPEDWKRLLWLCETPLCGPEQLYKYELHRFAKALRPGLKVMLTGQGSDEFNGGYSGLFVPNGDEAGGWQRFLAALEVRRRGGLLLAAPSGIAAWEQLFQRSPLSSEYLRSISSQKPLTDPWESYVASKWRDLQIYNCWHEDRTAMGNGIENRVPFLDHRLVEFVLRTPSSQRARLLWDKRILREAAQRYLPPEVCWRPKVPFFHGQDTRYTYRMMLQLLLQEDGALLEEAFSGGRAAEIIDREAVRDILRAMYDDPGLIHFEPLLCLVNMGLLEQMATSSRPEQNLPLRLALRPEIEIEAWDTHEKELARRLAIRSVDLHHRSVPALASNALLVQRQDSRQQGEWYLLVNGSVAYVLTEDETGSWLRLLREMDGNRSLGELLAAAGVRESDIRKYLVEAIDYGMVTVHQGRSVIEGEASEASPS